MITITSNERITFGAFETLIDAGAHLTCICGYWYKDGFKLMYKRMESGDVESSYTDDLKELYVRFNYDSTFRLEIDDSKISVSVRYV